MDSRILNILEWHEIEKKLKDLCHFRGSADYISSLSPLQTSHASRQMSKISALKELIERGDFADFSGLFHIDKELSLAERGGILTIPQLATVKKFTVASENLKKYLRTYSDEFPVLEEEKNKFKDLPVLLKLLKESLADDENLNTAQFPILGKLNRQIVEQRNEIEKKINRIIHSKHNEKTMQEKTFSTVNGRYVILVKSSMRSSIPGNVLDISSSGQTVYLEPMEISNMSNEMILLERSLHREIQKILTELTVAVAAHAAMIRNNLETIAYFDFLYAAANFSIVTDSSEPKLSPDPIIKLKQAHHPLLHLLAPDKIVKNDIELGEDYSCLIITGANTGGKTVTLKTLGLCTLFAMYGLHIPANGDSEIGIFKSIMADMGDDQNLSESLSTFSGQITIINEMLERADERTLVIIDEIIVGTSPAQGTALAQAILEHLADRGCKIVVTTHYSELKELPALDSRFQNASVRFDMDSLGPTYELVTGIPGISYAVEIAQNCGTGESVLARAVELIDSRESGVEALLEKVQKYEEEIKTERERVKTLNREISIEKEKLARRQRELEAATAKAKKREGIAFIEEIKSMREEIAQRITALQNLNQKELNSLNLELMETHETIHRELEKEKSGERAPMLKPADPKNLKKGDLVYVPSLNAEGKVEEIDPGKNTALLILGGTMKLRQNIDNLLINPERQRKNNREENEVHDKPSQKIMLKERAATIPSTMQTSYNTIDLRGQRVEGALRELDAALDRMERANVKYVVIIHGHGTGALRESVRDFLKTSIYVNTFRNGEYGEGGDGVTIAALR